MDGTDEVSERATPAAPTGPDRAQLHALYAGPLGEFVSRRTHLVSTLRAAGDKVAARSAAALRKPSTPAWVFNLLAADGRTEQELRELAGGIAAAVEAGERAELRTLAAAQRILVTDVLDRADELAAAAATKIPAAAREAVDAAVRGVLADAATADGLFTGVLVELPDPQDADAVPSLAIRSSPSVQQPDEDSPPPGTARARSNRSHDSDPSTAASTSTSATASPASAGPARPARRSARETVPEQTVSEQTDQQRAAAAAAERKRRLRAVQEDELVESRWVDTVQQLEQEQARLRAETTRVQQSLSRARTELRRAERRTERSRRLLGGPGD